MSRVILFDGVCNYCNAMVNFVIRKDRKGEIKFAAMQSPAGRALLIQHGIDPDNLRSFVFIDGDKVYERSDGMIAVARYLPGIWKAGTALRILPRGLRNSLYDFVAKNRYKWFGKKEQCMIPTPEVRSRFL
jgi:predicted DCC family thiol-disulfide oxidoreductase YuxK